MTNRTQKSYIACATAVLAACCSMGYAVEYSTGLKFSPHDPAQEVDLSNPGTTFSRVNALAPLPARVDLSGTLPPVGNQEFGSCVGWAVGYALKSQQEQAERHWGASTITPNFARRVYTQHVFSPLWIYNQINGGVDDGSSTADALNLLVSMGCDFKVNFDPDSYLEQPSAISKLQAKPYKIQSWAYLTVSTVNLKTALARRQQPVIIGIMAYPDLFNLTPANPVYDNRSGDIGGAHAVCVCGYDDTKRAFRFINSWGTAWGIDGYGWISYDLFARDLNADHYWSFVLDAFVANDIKVPQQPLSTGQEILLRQRRLFMLQNDLLVINKQINSFPNKDLYFDDEKRDFILQEFTPSATQRMYGSLVGVRNPSWINCSVSYVLDYTTPTIPGQLFVKIDNIPVPSYLQNVFWGISRCAQLQNLANQLKLRVDQTTAEIHLLQHPPNG